MPVFTSSRGRLGSGRGPPRSAGLNTGFKSGIFTSKGFGFGCETRGATSFAILGGSTGAGGGTCVLTICGGLGGFGGMGTSVLGVAREITVYRMTGSSRCGNIIGTTIRRLTQAQFSRKLAPNALQRGSPLSSIVKWTGAPGPPKSLDFLFIRGGSGGRNAARRLPTPNCVTEVVMAHPPNERFLPHTKNYSSKLYCGLGIFCQIREY